MVCIGVANAQHQEKLGTVCNIQGFVGLGVIWVLCWLGNSYQCFLSSVNIDIFYFSTSLYKSCSLMYVE